MKEEEVKTRTSFFFERDILIRLKIEAKRDHRSMASLLNKILDDNLPKLKRE